MFLFSNAYQEPSLCYHGPSCSWSDEDWKCLLANEKRTLAEDYPEGVVRTVSKMGGCVTEMTTYTEHNTITVTNCTWKMRYFVMILFEKIDFELDLSPVSLLHLQLIIHFDHR